MKGLPAILIVLVSVALSPLAHAQPFTINTIAGSSALGSADGTGNEAKFHWPKGAAIDESGNIFVSDTFNHTIRKITVSGMVSTLAGTAGSFGTNDGVGDSAQFYAPQGIALDAGGNAYVADTANNTIRRIAPNGTVSTLAGGAGIEGFADGIGSNAQFSRPLAVALDSATNIYVADTGNHIIRKISPGGMVSTFAGLPGSPGNLDGNMANNGTNGARFCSPAGIVVDGSGNVYVADTGNHTIRKITAAGSVTTLAGLPGVWGSADGTNRVARFFQPQGITIDSQGNLFVMDSGNHTMRMITPAGTNWVVTTVAGQANLIGDANGTGNHAQFYYATGIGLNSSGFFVIADSGNNIVRTAQPPMVRFDQISVLTNGSVHLSMSGRPDIVYTLLSTTDWTSWNTVAVLPSGDGFFQYTDSLSITNGARFYRLRQGQ